MSPPSSSPSSTTEPTSDSDSDVDVDASIFNPRTAEQDAAIQDFWDAFEGKNRSTSTADKSKVDDRTSQAKSAPLFQPDEYNDGEETVTAVQARATLKDRYGIHYDYVEALLGLLVWLFFVTLLYQWGAYSGYRYAHVMRRMAHWLGLVFVVPFGVIILLWWIEVKREEKVMLENAREKRRVIENIKEATRRGKKDV